MRTVDKALGLLDLFTVDAKEWGLSDLSRAANLDKATTLRMLRALEKHNIIEQQQESKKYRLGTRLLKLARVRDTSFPTTTLVQPFVATLANEVQETAHMSLISGDQLVSISVAEPARPSHVTIDPSGALPLHATASGIAYLSFAPEPVREAFLNRRSFAALTDETVIQPKRLRELVQMSRAQGFALSPRSFDADVFGIGAPIFDSKGNSHGAIAVAAVATRVDSEATIQKIVEQVMLAAEKITQALGCEPAREFRLARRKLSEGFVGRVGGT